MMKQATARTRRAHLGVLALLASFSVVLGGLQSANALDVPAPWAAQSPQVIHIGNPALADQPQLSIEGTVLVVAIDSGTDSRTEYSVATESGTVRIGGDVDVLTGGSTFTGTVALPASLTDRASGWMKSRIKGSALAPISATAVEGSQLLVLAQTETEPLQVVTASITLASISIGTAAHTVDVAVLNGAAFSDTDVDTNVAGLNTFWTGQSSGAITSVTRPGAVQRYTSPFLDACQSDSQWQNDVWAEAAAKFGKTIGDYFSASGRHLIVLANVPPSSSTNYCSEGIGSVGGGVNGGGIVIANIAHSIDLQTIAHEFGHNLGLGHADVHECANDLLVEGTSAQGCKDYEYEDLYDVMSMGFEYPGIGNTNQLAALNVTDKVKLGFLPSGDLSVVTAHSTSVALAPASASSGIRGVQVADPTTGDTYFVEYRAGTGMDSGAFYTKSFPAGAPPIVASLRPGVRILKLRGTLPGNHTVALALLKQPGDPVKMLAMKAGDVFHTPSGGLSVNFTGVSGGGAVLTVTRNSLPDTQRIAGADRYATAVEVSKKAFPTPGAGIPVVYVAQGANYPDALAAAPAAVEEGGPLLLTDSNVLTPIVTAEIQRLNPAKIVVVGGTGVIKPAVFTALSALVPPGKTIRLGGADRYETARLVVRYAFLDNGGTGAATAYVATGTGFPDALSASAAAGAVGSPVVLINGSLNSVDAATKALLQDLGVTQVRIAGGTGVVTSGAATSLATVATVTRFAGNDRFDTNHRVNSAIFSSADTVYLATGLQFPDALAGAALAGARGAPLYLVQTQCIPATIRSDIIAGGASTAWLIGGTGVLTARVASFASC